MGLLLRVVVIKGSRTEGGRKGKGGPFSAGAEGHWCEAGQDRTGQGRRGSKEPHEAQVQLDLPMRDLDRQGSGEYDCFLVRFFWLMLTHTFFV